MNIYQIKRLTSITEPLFFSKDTMKWFGQTLSSFKVYKQKDGRFKIIAKSRDINGTYTGETIRFFNPLTNKLDRI